MLRPKTKECANRFARLVGWGLAARRSAGGIEFEDLVRAKQRGFCWARGLYQKSEKRKHAGSGLRPLRSNSAAAATALAATAVRLKQDFRRLGWGGRRIRHRVMARHGRSKCRRRGYTQAVHSARLGHRQRPKGRDEHDQQQTPSCPAVSPPHLRKA